MDKWTTGTPSEEGWYLLALVEDGKIKYDANKWVNVICGWQWLYAMSGKILAYQNITPYKEMEDGKVSS